MSQTNGSPQYAPPLGSAQHACPSPPQATQLPALQIANGDVHPTLPAQHAWPISPHAPLMHPPAVHVPCPPPHAPAGATQRWLDPSQQPPPEQKFPSQHGWLAPPHVAHLFAVVHASPDAVQKSPAAPFPFGLPLQQACPLPPHGPVLQLPLLQLPNPGPHELPPPLRRHLPATQQRPPWQESFWQHGAPFDPPHAMIAPFSQTLFAEGVSPLA